MNARQWEYENERLDGLAASSQRPGRFDFQAPQVGTPSQLSLIHI